MSGKLKRLLINRQDASWFSFVCVTLAVMLPACLLGYNVVYTDGEQMQLVYYLVLILAGLSALAAIRRRDVAIVLVAFLGGALLTWQAWQLRKWALIHEDITAIVTAALKQFRETGSYPKSVDDLSFQHPFVKEHISGFSSDTTGFSINYFINQRGISYSYSSKEGYWYYPD